MSRLRLAVATARFRSPLRDVPQRAAETGAAGVQFDARHELRPGDLSETGRRQLLHALRERELRVASLEFPLRRPLYDPEQLDARMAALQQSMQFAWDLGAQIVTCRIGRLPDEDEAAGRDRLVELLADLARFGNHVGVTLSITPSGDSGTQLLSLISEIKDGLLGIDYDPASCVMSRQNPGSVLRELHSIVTHFTARDAICDRDGAGREVPVGRGEVDWETMVALLDEMGYNGWLTVGRREGDDPQGDATRAISYLNNVASS